MVDPVLGMGKVGMQDPALDMDRVGMPGSVGVEDLSIGRVDMVGLVVI